MPFGSVEHPGVGLFDTTRATSIWMLPDSAASTMACMFEPEPEAKMASFSESFSEAVVLTQ
jgi:hypothetical protein